MVKKNKLNKRLLFFYLLVVASLVIILGFVFNPSFASKWLSSDGVLEKQTIIKIYFIDLFVLTIGSIFFFYSLIGVIKSDYAITISKKILSYFKKIDIKINIILIFLNFYKKDDSLLLQRVIQIWIIILSISLVFGLITVRFVWEQAQGYEYFWIAQSLEGGHGFSFPSEIESTKPVEYYFPTAHEEPVYPIFMALTSKVFGKYGRLVVLILQIVAFYFTSFVIYHLARKIFNHATGLLAGLILPLFPSVEHLAGGYFGPHIFAGLMISISAYLIIWCSENMSVRKGIFLGFILGLNSLLYAPTLIHIPLSILFMVISMRPYRIVILKTAFAILFTTVIVISPWTMRNFLVFGNFIPIKTGLGKIAYESNPILATSFSSGSHGCPDDPVKLLKARDAKEAIDLSKSSIMQSHLLNLSYNCIKRENPKGHVNEVEWNTVYLKKTFDFILSEPRTFATLAFYRIVSFCSFGSIYISVISLFSGIGILLSLKNKRAILLILFILAYAGTYLIVNPFWYRYRYPIEPVVTVIASYVPVLFISKLYAFLRN